MPSICLLCPAHQGKFLSWNMVQDMFFIFSDCELYRLYPGECCRSKLRRHKGNQIAVFRNHFGHFPLDLHSATWSSVTMTPRENEGSSQKLLEVEQDFYCKWGSCSLRDKNCWSCSFILMFKAITWVTKVRYALSVYLPAPPRNNMVT